MTIEAIDVDIPCRDGVILAGKLYQTVAEPEMVVTIHAATMIAQTYYTKFAAYLASQKAAVLTYDYRGVGLSRRGPLRELDAGFSTWAEFDVDAVLRWQAETYPNASRFLVGHSFGGQALGLVESANLLTGAVLVAAQGGCLHFISPAIERYKAALWLRGLGPLTAALVGYGAASWFKIGEDIPKRTMDEWRKWTVLENYFFDDPELKAAERYARPEIPVLAIGLTDDPWGPAEAIHLIADRLVHCDVEFRQYGPADANGQPVGHIGLFRSRHQDTLWPKLWAWMVEHAKSKVA